MSDTEDDPNKRTAKPKRALKPRGVIAPKDAPTKQAPTKQATTEEPAPAKAKERRRRHRAPLTKVEHAFLTDFYYKKSGFSGRDVLYKQLQAHYEKHDTPKKMRISRRRMWELFLDLQEVNQLHRQARKNSIAIKPINSRYKLDKAQADLIIRGGDSARKYKGILMVIDIATRKLWSELLTSTTSKAVASAMDKILTRVHDELPDADKEQKKKGGEAGKSKSFTIIQTDNGSEFKSEFSKLLQARNVKQLFGVANKSTSQSIVERVNQTVQAGMEKEHTATGARWYDLVKKHTDFYNDKSNRNLRIKPDSEGANKYFTPNELFQGERATLTQLYNDKDADLGKQNKRAGKEVEFNVGNTVRIVDFAKRKGELVKGFKQNWLKELFVIAKKLPPPANKPNRPTRFHVKDKESGKLRVDPNKRPITFTMNDLQLVRGEVQKAPDDIQVEEKDGVGTRSGEKEAPSTPPPPKAKAPPKPKPPPKLKAPPKEDELLGKTVVSYIDYKKKEYKITGSIVNKQRRKKGASYVWWYKVKWDKKHAGKWEYKEHEYIKKADVAKMLAA